MRHGVPVLLCALLICSVVFGAVPAAGQPQPGETHLEVQLQDNGDAEWSVTVAVPIEDDDDRADFEAFSGRFEAGAVDIDLGVDAFERAAAQAAPESDREMEINSVRRESEVVNETENGEIVSEKGLLRVRFTWDSFARIDDDDTLYVDDVFNTTDGTWLPGLSVDQSLTIRSPPGYGGPSTSPIGADRGDLHWEGPMTFEPGYFTIVYPASSPGPGPTPDNGPSTALVIGAIVLSGGALLVGLYLLLVRRRADGSDGTPNDNVIGSTLSTELGETSDEATGGSKADVTPPEPDASPTEQDLDLLSDEERVEHLLEENGGRMKQAMIVKETDWSNAKVSQLLSSMDETGQVDKLRIGRENLISLPGEGVNEIKRDAEEK